MRILFAIDLSEPRAVTQVVEALAARLEADLFVLHVMDPTPAAAVSPVDPLTGLSGYAPYALYDPQLEENIARAEEHAMQAFLVERFEQPVRAALRLGDPARTILEDAEEHDVDLIILGKRRHSRLERLFLGSVAADVLRETTRPTLFVPIEAEEA